MEDKGWDDVRKDENASLGEEKVIEARLAILRKWIWVNHTYTGMQR